MIFVLWILIAVVCLGLAVLIAASAYFIHFMTKPKVMTEEKSISDEIANGTWKTLDDYATEDWNVTTRDGYLLHGTIIKGAQNSNWVIITHGWTNRRTEAHKYVSMFHTLGYNCYIYDLRNHGKNKKCWTSMGPRESRDIIDIALALKSRYGNDISIGLHGESLGSASSVLALGLASEPFSFLISDCGYASLKDLMIDLCTRMYHLPPVFAYAASTLNVLLHGYRLFSVEPYKALEHTTTPVLFIHGADDDFIVPSNARKMYDMYRVASSTLCCPEPELYLCPGANHALSYATNPAEYEKQVGEFLAAKVL